MADRQRTTWPDSGDKAANSSQPVLPVERARAASAHPATPDEGAAHPAHQPDPTQPADYENGDTSSWAEDPTKGPYPNSAHPATPDEGSAHPAHRQTETAPNEPGGEQITNEDLGVSKAAARELRAAVERKAAKCIRIASELLGAKATVAAVEDQALDFMDMSDSAIVSTLGRLAADESDDEAEDDDGKKASQDDALLRRLIAEEEEAESDKEEADDKEDKKATDKSGNAEILAAIQALSSRMDGFETGKSAMGDDELLASLLAEEEVEATGHEPAAEDDVEAMLYSMIEDEPESIEEELLEDEFLENDGDLGIDMGLVEDPMGLLGEVEMDADEEELLATLFADTRMAADEDAEDAEDEDEGKKASRKPRPKKASAGGATRLGRVAQEPRSKTAADIKELEKLWPTAPDVTSVFG